MTRICCHPEAGEARRRTSQSQESPTIQSLRVPRGEYCWCNLFFGLCNLRSLGRSFVVYATQDDSVLECWTVETLNRWIVNRDSCNFAWPRGQLQRRIRSSKQSKIENRNSQRKEPLLIRTAALLLAPLGLLWPRVNSYCVTLFVVRATRCAIKVSIIVLIKLVIGCLDLLPGSTVWCNTAAYRVIAEPVVSIGYCGIDAARVAVSA